MSSKKECGYQKCGIVLKELLITIDDGKELIHFCPNHALIYIIEEKKKEKVVTHPSALEQKLTTCDACNKESELQYQTTTYGGETINIELCHEDLSRLIKLDLQPSGFINLRNKFGIFHEIHDDFYDEDGYSLQPVGEE